MPANTPPRVAAVFGFLGDLWDQADTFEQGLKEDKHLAALVALVKSQIECAATIAKLYGELQAAVNDLRRRAQS